MPPYNFLGVTRNNGDIDEPATKIELEHGISSNLWMVSLAPGLIPIYEEHAARLERGISLETWEKMNVDEKAMIVAVKRIMVAMSNLQSEAEIKAMEKK
jgi:hypothetical protein